MKNKVVRALLVVVLACNLFVAYQPSVIFANNVEQIISAKETDTTKPLKVIGVIPARYASSRFPGKPLADICGKPMVWWVYQQAKKVPELSEVYVATDDERIEAVCKQYDMNVIMTSKDHPTGTDRVAEVAEKIDADYYVVCMGDEPLVSVSDISLMCQKILSGKVHDAALLTLKFKNSVDVINPTTIKLALNKNSELIFMSRLPLPYPKANLDYDYYKNIGIYAYSKDTLNFFKSTEVGSLEKIEDMELLRLLENHKIIDTFEVDSISYSVDTQKDLERVRNIISENLKKN